MGDQVRLSRGKLRSPGRGTKKPRAHNPAPRCASAAEFQVFGERARREFENSSSPMRIFDHETLKYLAVNDAAVKFYGYAREEFLALTLRDTRHSDEHAAQLATLKEPAGYLRHGKTRRQIKKSGEIVIVEMVTQDILFNGRKARLSLTIDVTERERTEQALRESNEFLRSVIESSRDCIKVLDLDGRLQWISAGGQRLMEIDDAKPLLQKSYLDFWSGADHEAASNAVAAARAGGTSRFEGYCPTGKGTPKWWDELATPILDADGRPEKLLVVSRDITERKYAENALRESEERFRQLAENIREVFWINTLAGDHIDYISPAYEEIWGRSCESLYRDPRSWMEPIHPDDLPAVRSGHEIIARGERSDVDYRIIRPDGTLRWIRDRSYPMRRSDGTLLTCGIAEDITDQKHAEQRRHSQAIHQRDALVREVHHRIKNSLQGIIGLLRQKTTKNPAIAPEIEEIIGQLQSVALVYGLQETRPDGRLGLAAIMDAICLSAESLFGGSVEFVIERESRRPVCVTGEEAVSVAFALNELVFNALKHQPAEVGKKHARVALRETGDTAEICISNRGRLPKRFDFAKGRSVGNGLALVRTLLAPPGCSVAFKNGSNTVEVVLKLAPPLLARRRQALTGGTEVGDEKQERSTTALAGGGRRPAGAGRAG